MLKHADTAMYHAKTDAAAAIAAYAAAMSTRLRDWLELEARLRRAVQDNMLQLVFQPKFRLSDNRLAGVEALLRWHDAEHGDVSPNRFVEIAEDSGLILDMGGWVVRAACRQLRKWLDHGLAVTVAVNVSGKELLHGDPARIVEQETAAFGVPASLIEIEITESLLIKDSVKVRSALAKLRQLGCRIALDDFGTGYSSLAYITRAFHPIGSRSTRRSCTTSIAPPAMRPSPGPSCRWERALGSPSPPKASSAPDSSSSCVREAATRRRDSCFRDRSRPKLWSSASCAICPTHRTNSDGFRPIGSCAAQSLRRPHSAASARAKVVTLDARPERRKLSCRQPT